MHKSPYYGTIYKSTNVLEWLLIQHDSFVFTLATSHQLDFEDEPICAICLKMFTDPVAIPCGHNICMKCKTTSWDKEVATKIYSCPKCHGSSSHKTQLCKNSVRQKLSSCLEYMASFCEIHIRTHCENAALRLHRVHNPVKTTEKRQCKRHDRPLDLFCNVEDANLRVLEFIEKEEQVALSKTEETIAKREQKINELNKEKLVMGEVSEIVDNITFLQEPKALSNKSLKPLSQDSGEVDIRFLGLGRVVINLKEELTAQKCLSLMKGNLKVENIWPDEVYCVDHTERFDRCVQLLCAEKLDKHVHNWEVETSKGCCVGVTSQDIMRKGAGHSCLIGRKSLSWGSQLFNTHCSAWHNNVEDKTKSEKYEQIGVYLNYPNGILAFYAVSDISDTLLYRF
ncbi:E3 ubiquitin/ISG15 ligase TRIM25-like [Amblyraja radiata]|uniref:E3 ubiquitin/ISG15 ligase TRIM25-like n=1 Tax=Amblyraja radiata TaxID=386614 RepID=UPI001401D979|nr:E3 ubiquitin/ISG15 ligase TRIM25-like [Amblyraja radiata]